MRKETCYRSSATLPVNLYSPVHTTGYHSTDIPLATPFLSELASKGVKLSQYHTQPSCTPSRATIMSGQWTYKIGYQNMEIHYDYPVGMPLSVKLMPEFLSELGYKTHGTLRSMRCPLARCPLHLVACQSSVPSPQSHTPALLRQTVSPSRSRLWKVEHRALQRSLSSSHERLQLLPWL